MKRLILIGNGFDKAHDINSSYEDFVKNYFYEIIIDLSKVRNRNESFVDELIEIKVIKNESTGVGLDEFLKLDDILSRKHNGKISYRTQSTKGDYNFDASIKFNSIFFGKIIHKVTSRWVDIENEYFAFLNSYLQSSAKDEKGIEGINKDFLIIRNKLIEYLKKQEKKNE